MSSCSDYSLRHSTRLLTTEIGTLSNSVSVVDESIDTFKESQSKNKAYQLWLTQQNRVDKKDRELSKQQVNEFELSDDLGANPKFQQVVPSARYHRNRLGYLTTNERTFDDKARHKYSHLLNSHPELCKSHEIYLSKRELLNLLHYDRRQNPEFMRLFDGMCSESMDNVTQYGRHDGIIQLATESGAKFMEEVVEDKHGREYIKHSVIVNRFKYVINIFPVYHNGEEKILKLDRGFIAEYGDCSTTQTCLQSEHMYQQIQQWKEAKVGNAILKHNEKHTINPNYRGKIFLSETYPIKPCQTVYQTEAGLYLCIEGRPVATPLSALDMSEYRDQFVSQLCQTDMEDSRWLTDVNKYTHPKIAAFRLGILKKSIFKPECQDLVVISETLPSNDCLAVYKTKGGLYLVVETPMVVENPMIAAKPEAAQFGSDQWVTKSIEEMDYPQLDFDSSEWRNWFCKFKQELSSFQAREWLIELDKYKEEKHANYRLSILTFKLFKQEFQQAVTITKAAPTNGEHFQRAYKTSGGLYLVFKTRIDKARVHDDNYAQLTTSVLSKYEDTLAKASN
ncbi:hypothetical protein JQC92_07460 [Shewanella sp. 202IG2-18]|uniref:hypothetical protein n=1 Tax=Parashewanella hymeniacidonis TaxID=2807618 RepID=UPI001960CA5A|nr:hypothetical protein [Parashewanella hymeniacidonis]MBM7071878.1 hypothetical protein [Parashewanella hymeniacidonis]